MTSDDNWQRQIPLLWPDGNRQPDGDHNCTSKQSCCIPANHPRRPPARSAPDIVSPPASKISSSTTLLTRSSIDKSTIKEPKPSSLGSRGIHFFLLLLFWFWNSSIKIHTRIVSESPHPYRQTAILKKLTCQLYRQLSLWVIIIFNQWNPCFQGRASHSMQTVHKSNRKV